MKSKTDELQQNLNELSTVVSSLEAAKKRLESQVDNLIEVVGKTHTPKTKNEEITKAKEKECGRKYPANRKKR